MDIFLPNGFQPSARTGLSSRTRPRACSVKAGEAVFPVLRIWDGGFAVAADLVPVLSGLVDLYDGTEHLGQYAIRRCETAMSERSFVVRRAPSVNYAAVPEMDQLQAFQRHEGRR